MNGIWRKRSGFASTYKRAGSLATELKTRGLEVLVLGNLLTRAPAEVLMYEEVTCPPFNDS